MKCEKCGIENLEGSSFCKNCGEIFKKEDKINDDNHSSSLIVYCKCGQKIEQDWKLCSKCKTPINVEIKNTTIKDSNSYIYIIIFVASIACGYFFKLSYTPLIAIIAIVTGYINCPNSRAIKVLFWLTILVIILYMFFIIWMIVLCNNAIKSPILSNGCPN